MKQILLTGATGFLGSHLLETLLANGYKVTILKRSTSNTWRIDHLLDQVSAYDIDQVPVHEAFNGGKVDAVIHTACAYGRNNESTVNIINTNVIFGIKLLELCKENDVKVFLNTDTFFSGKSLAHHLFDYSLSKRQFSEWLKSKSAEMRVVNLRLQHVYGPNDNPNKFIPWIIYKIVNCSGRIALTSGEQKRDFVYVNDVVNAYMLAIDYNFGESGFFEFDVGTGRQVKVNEFVKAVYDYLKEREPISCVLGFGDLDNIGSEVEEINCDISQLRKIGWVPEYDFYDGVIDMLSKEGY